ncbi:hypothetical protein ACQUSR_09870 [Streptomyces sp. P1-3]|uniref:hypothetical protein n=1 Tax=Streptomyces sp. P1-3 TaxID=3421658 RepID=UPI003D368572
MGNSWIERDLPVLRKIIEVMGQSGIYAHEGDLVGTAGLSEEGARAALVSLGDQGLIVTGTHGLNSAYLHVEAITVEGHERAAQ